jgi:hypothetical protein
MDGDVMSFLLRLLLPLMNALCVAAIIGFIVTVKHDLFMMKETKHRRELEMMDKQTELERVLRMPVFPATRDAPPDTDTQTKKQAQADERMTRELSQSPTPEESKEVPDVPAPPA